MWHPAPKSIAYVVAMAATRLLWPGAGLILQRLAGVFGRYTMAATELPGIALRVYSFFMFYIRNVTATLF